MKPKATCDHVWVFDNQTENALVTIEAGDDTMRGHLTVNFYTCARCKNRVSTFAPAAGLSLEPTNELNRDFSLPTYNKPH